MQFLMDKLVIPSKLIPPFAKILGSPHPFHVIPSMTHIAKILEGYSAIIAAHYSGVTLPSDCNSIDIISLYYCRE